MLTTKEEIWEVIYHYFPAYREVRESGFDLNLQSAISAATEKAFIYMCESPSKEGVEYAERIEAGRASFNLYVITKRLRELGPKVFFEKLD